MKLPKWMLISKIVDMASDAFMPTKQNDKYLEDLLEELHTLTVPVLENIYLNAKYYVCTSIKHSLLKYRLEGEKHDKN